MDILIALWAFSCVVAVNPKALYPYESTKDLVATVGGWLLLGLALASGKIGVCAPAGIVVFAMAVWWVVAAARAQRSDIALRAAGRMTFGLITGLAVGATQSALVAVSIASLVDVAYCAGRWRFGWKWLGEVKDDRKNANGVQGNANFFGFVRVLAIFIDLHLGGLFYAAVIAELVGLRMSRCRGAILGAFCGLGWYFGAVAQSAASAFLGGSLAIGLCLFSIRGLPAWKRSAQNIRLSIWRAFWPYVKKHLFLGAGHDQAKLHAPGLIADARAAGIGFFPADWNTRKAHNDFAQMVADAGLVALAGWLCVLFLAIGHGQLDNPALASGVVAMVVCGMTMHTLYITAVAVPFGLVLGALLHDHVAVNSPTGHALWLCVAAWVAAAWLYVVPAIDHYRFRVRLRHAMAHNLSGLGRAMAMDPRDTMGNVMMAHAALAHKQLPAAYVYAVRAAMEFDGEIKLHDVLRTNAAVLAHAGAMPLAQVLATDALRYEGKKP